MINSVAQKQFFSLISIAIWLAGLAAGIYYLKQKINPIERILESINKGHKLTDEEIRLTSENTLNLPMYSSKLYFAIWIFSTLVLFIVALFSNLNQLSYYSIWIGGVAGSIGCPQMVMTMCGRLLCNA